MGEQQGPQRWRALGRLLPAEVRDRVFEPAFSDVLRDHLASGTTTGRGLPFGIQVIRTLAGCVPIALPRLFIRRGRLTRVGKVTALALSLFIVLAVAVSKISAVYAASAPAP